MPWPAKPPMTLKEAKRAYKKDSTGFKFTPSQLARADRQDAQEEKRRKALEKEKIKQDNKRKREDKAERERAVKRKMLDEGRITVEDTWGKVTASQPRLNKFFAQPPADTGPPSRLRHELTSKSDDDAQGNLVDGLESEDEDNRKPNEVEMKNDAAAASALEIDAPDVLSSPIPPLQPTQNPRSVDINNSPGLSKTLHKQPSPLQELQSSRINVTAGHIQRVSSALKTRTHYVSEKVDDLESSTVVKEPPKLLEHKPAPLPKAQISQLALPAPTRQSDQTRVLRSADNLLSVSSKARHSNEPRQALSASKCDGRNQLAEEDFTDGIDDNAFLEMLGAQNDTDRERYSSASLFDCSDSKPSPGFASNDDTINTIELPHLDWLNEEQQKRPALPKEDSTTDALPAVLNESFSAVFNEIDDSELIAFAEQVEASMVASPQLCSKPTKATADYSPAESKTSKPRTTPKTECPLSLEKSIAISTGTKASTFIKHGPPNAENSIATSAVAPAGINNPSSSAIKTTPSSLLVPAEVMQPQIRSKRRRAMPWDDIEGPGPSTQAAMLELLEQAEAQMER